MNDLQTDTRQRLLAIAAEVFAERGYHAATVRHIVYRAQVNLAAISYHFGGKDALYRAVLQHVLNRGEGVAAAEPLGPPRDRLRQVVGAILQPTGADALADRILAWETLSPTGFLEDSKTPGGHLPMLQKLVTDLTGLAGEDAHLRALWLLGQCLLFARPAAWRALGLPDLAALDTSRVDWLVQLCLNGLLG